MTEEDDVLAVEAAYDLAWCAGDLDGLMACFAPDAVIVNPRGEVAKGTREIRAALGGFLAGEGAGTDHRSSVKRVSLVSEGIAVVDGRAVLSPHATGPDRSILGHAFTDVLRRTADRRLIAHVRAYGLVSHP